MSLLPMIKVEFKRNLWVAWAAVLLILFWLGGNLNNDLMNDAYDAMRNFTDSFAYMHSVYENFLVCSAWWTVLFVFVQFGRDSLVFKQALPYTDKKLLLSKFTAFLAVLAVSLLTYALVCAVMVHKYDYMFYVMKHIGTSLFGMGYITPAGMLITGISAALFALAVYWGLVLCCCLCRNSVQGCALGIFYAVTFISFNLFIEDMMSGSLPLSFYVAQCLKNISPNAFVYTEQIMTSVLWLIVIIITAPLSFALYGGGESKHPLFRYAFADKLTIAAAALCFGCSGRNLLGLHENELWLGFVIGAISGAAGAAVINIILKRRAAK